jgi:5,5'-dehydrodivanillate O-demethylase oxygenase subunit
MLKVAENERFTRVGPGTPMEELMRRYWHPIAAVARAHDWSGPQWDGGMDGLA